MNLCFNGKPVTRKEELFRLMGKFSSFSLQGICRYLWLRLRGKSILVVGSCHGCGRCCRSISLEGTEGWLRSENSFQRIVGIYPEYQRFEIIGRDRQGFLLFNCTWCTPQGTCRDYDRRLPLCSNYPESSLVFAGGRLLSGCGYRFAEVVPFNKILKQALRNLK